MMYPTVKQTAAGKCAVMRGEWVLATFDTNADAWRWIDQHERHRLWARSSTAEGLGVIYYEVP